MAKRETRQTKSSPAKQSDGLRPEYRRSDFGPMARGKYYRQALTASNLILLDPDLLPSSPTPNRSTAPCDCR